MIPRFILCYCLNKKRERERVSDIFDLIIVGIFEFGCSIVCCVCVWGDFILLLLPASHIKFGHSTRLSGLWCAVAAAHNIIKLKWGRQIEFIDSLHTHSTPIHWNSYLFMNKITFQNVWIANSGKEKEKQQENIFEEKKWWWARTYIKCSKNHSNDDRYILFY